MSFELFFLYDTHCPWSYRTSVLVDEIVKTYPNTPIHLMHCARFDGEQALNDSTMMAVNEVAQYQFSEEYINQRNQPLDSTLAANLMSWTQNRATKQAWPLLKALFEAHFEQGNVLENEDELEEIVRELKLSPPAKVFTTSKFTKDAEAALGDIHEFQQIIGTEAIPALLMAIGERLVLLNHNLYLTQPKEIVAAVELELAQ